jgi:carbon storage regulator
MLVLSRKKGQKLILANDVVITVLETRGDSVKLGIQAPKHIWVYREEVLDEIRQSNQQSQQLPKSQDLTQALDLLGQAIQTIEKHSGQVSSPVTTLSVGHSPDKRAKKLTTQTSTPAASPNPPDPEP